MAKKAYVGVCPGFRPNTVNGYIDTGYVYDISKTTKIEIKCKFDDTTTYSTVCGNHFIPNFSFGHNENGQWWAVLFSDSVTSSVTMSANTWYTVEITLANGTQTVKVNGTQIFSKTHTSSSDNTHSIYLYTRNSSGTKEASTTVWIQYCKIWENGVLKRDMTPHIPHDYSYNKWSFFDNVEKKFYDISGNLSYNYPLARRIRKIYAGINNVVKKVKKAYIGVNGVAKLFWVTALKKLSNAHNLSSTRQNISAASIGNYALFAGGYVSTGTYSGHSSAEVDSYTNTLVYGAASNLSVARRLLWGTSNQNYAIFAGGLGDNTTYKRDVDAYNSSLTRTTAASLPSNAGGASIRGARVGNYAVFAGGKYSDGNYSDKVTAYNGSLTQSSATVLPRGVYEHMSASVGNYVIFAGGARSGVTDYDEATAYNNSLTRSTLAVLSQSRYLGVGGSLPSYALIIGGRHDNTVLDSVIDAYNTNLVKVSVANFPTAMSGLAATSIDEYLIVGANNTMCVYTNDLVRTSTTPLSVSRTNLVATTVGDYALFAGNSNVVDVYGYE